jgi:hypothetical protein
LNYSYISDIPLGQAGRASSYVLSLVIQYLAFFMIFSNDFDVVVKLLLVAFVSGYYSYALLWTLKTSFNQLLMSTLVIFLVVALLSIVLSLWPISASIISLILALVLYIFNGIALEIRERITNYLWLEYFALSFLAIFTLLLTSNWGINGYLI